MANFIKVVRETTQLYGVPTHEWEPGPWAKKTAIIDDELHVRVIDVWFASSEEDVQELLASDARRNESRCAFDKVRLIYKGKVHFDDAFIDKVKEAVRECRSFGEFEFNARKKFRKETIDRLGGDDRDKRDFIREALRAR